jgi:single-stranded-DNA-specific exonuclease
MTLSPAKRWRLRTPPPPTFLDSVAEHPLLVQVLWNRGLQSGAAIADFLSASDVERADPYRLPDMEVAVERILRALEDGEIICVYGDFDADGVTATALLTMALQAAGGSVGAYIPDRVDEGYGLNIDAIERIASKGASLIVTVDCGMRSLAEARRAAELGVDLIITDHHSTGHTLPQAVAVINPERLAERGEVVERLAGVGVAYRLAQAVLRAQATRLSPRLSLARAAEIEEELLDLVALGTVADMMPLTGQNRALVQRGLQRLSSAPRPGVAALLLSAGVSGAVDASAIGFRLGPRINAAGRLSSAKLAYDLLRARDLASAQPLAARLEELNSRRQSMTQQMQAAAEAQVLADFTGGAEGGLPPLLFASSADFAHGVVGLVAGKLSDRYYRPAVVVHKGPEESRGSARSIDEFDISEALDEVSGLLVRHGGHSHAAGFTVRTQQLQELADALGAIAQRTLAGYSDLRPTVDIDLDVPLCDVNYGLHQQFARLEPTGQENQPPVLLSRRLLIRQSRTVGSGRHLRLVVDGAASPQGPHALMDAVAFHQGHLAPQLPEGAWIDAVYTLETNEYNGRRTLQLNVRDLCSSEQGSG